MAKAAHRFGNASTDLKLEVISSYLAAFNTALRAQFPKLLYIDVFSGSGAREVMHKAQPESLFEPAREAWLEERKGSARVALETEPPFSQIIFVEKKIAFCKALQELASRYPDREVIVLRGEANQKVLQAISRPTWVGSRGVMFIDPYGMQMEWSTLSAIARTQAIDVWYLVSLQGLYRQAAQRRSDITPKKRERLDAMLGTKDWERAWYAPPDYGGLFETIQVDQGPGPVRTASVDDMQRYVFDRLKSLFPYVSPNPLRLQTANGAPGFALFFACSNPKPAAFGLAARIASHILKAGSSSQ